MLLTAIRSSWPRHFIRQLLAISTCNVHHKTKMETPVTATISTNEVSEEMQQQKQVLYATLANAKVLPNKTIAPPQLRREKQLQAAKKKSIPYIPGIVNLQVLGAGANGAPTAVYLFTDQARYLFNCGEGTQRLAHEHKTKLARLEHIFVTRNTWPMVGGFPGLALTVQDAGVKQMALHGPPHLESILRSMKRFVVLKTLRVDTRDCTQLEGYEDAVMRVQYIPLYQNYTPECASTPVVDATAQVVMAYICLLKPRPGALNLEKCVEKGVPPGPLLGLLKNGQDVTLPNGTVVHSQDVSEPNEEPQSFVFLDVPSAEYLPALEAQASRFCELQKEIKLVVHFTPGSMLKNNCYQNFMHQHFRPETQHLYLSAPENNFSGYVAAHRIQYQLNQLNQRIFPLLSESQEAELQPTLKKSRLQEEENIDQSLNGHEKEEQVSLPQLTNIQSLTSFHLRPPKGLDRSLEAKLNPCEYIEETMALPEFRARLSKLQIDQETLNIPPFTKTNQPASPRIVFLGTGSCIPNKTRNVSAIFVQTNASCMLLDCGEGTYGQIVRFFGKKHAPEIIRNLTAIYISHLHADHHIGLIGLLNARKSVCSRERLPPLLLFAPVQIQPWLDYYNAQIEDIASEYKLIGNAEMLEQPLDLTDMLPFSGFKSIATCLVRHCPHSFGVSLQLSSGNRNDAPIKLTYSGDSMPCPDLVQLGYDSTVLIHEATMEDDLEEEAKVKMHSTISQALEQGRAMRAQYIILTHFSQRYAKMPRLSGGEGEDEAMRNVAIAFDNMEVTVQGLKYFYVMYPALKALFAEHAEELEQKALKREMKLERKRKLMDAD